MQVNREFKHDVYARRQTAKVTSEFLFFSCNPNINHTKIKKCLLLFTVNTNVLILLYRKLKTDDKSFIFGVCQFAVNVMLNLSNKTLYIRDKFVIWTTLCRRLCSHFIWLSQITVESALIVTFLRPLKERKTLFGVSCFHCKAKRGDFLCHCTTVLSCLLARAGKCLHTYEQSRDYQIFLA